MDNKTVFSFLAGIGVVMAVAFLWPPVESGIPPTPAWDVITVVYNDTIPISNGTMQAFRYNDNMTIITDGSILVGFAEYP